MDGAPLALYPCLIAHTHYPTANHRNQHPNNQQQPTTCSPNRVQMRSSALVLELLSKLKREGRLPGGREGDADPDAPPRP